MGRTAPRRFGSAEELAIPAQGRLQQFAARAPAPALRPFVRRYIGYRQHDVTLTLHRGLPSRSLTVILSLAGPVHVVGGPGTGMSLHSLVGGMHMEPVLIQQEREQEGIHLELHPLGVTALLGVPAGELFSTVCDPADLPVRWGARLADRVHAQSSWQARFAVLDAELGADMAARARVPPVTLGSEIGWAWQRMSRCGGNTGIAELASEIGWSRRHFGARFAEATGLAPKSAARLMRFERSRDLLRSSSPGGAPSLSELAAVCGYYDQAHLASEWRQLAGCSPSTWIRQELPFLQDAGSEPAADSPS